MRPKLNERVVLIQSLAIQFNVVFIIMAPHLFTSYRSDLTESFCKWCGESPLHMVWRVITAHGVVGHLCTLVFRVQLAYVSWDGDLCIMAVAGYSCVHGRGVSLVAWRGQALRVEHQNVPKYLNYLRLLFEAECAIPFYPDISDPCRQ